MKVGLIIMSLALALVMAGGGERHPRQLAYVSLWLRPGAHPNNPLSPTTRDI
jgi:hypothetical protein